MQKRGTEQVKKVPEVLPSIMVLSKILMNKHHFHYCPKGLCQTWEVVVVDVAVLCKDLPSKSWNADHNLSKTSK